jgi:apolipoprotein D and lipocalin family protein
MDSQTDHEPVGHPAAADATRRRLLLAAPAALLAACVGVPDGLRPVGGFEPERYLGTWYEIARLDHSFERGLSRVTAEYRRRDDGGLTVINRGWSDGERRWKEATGKAYFVEGPQVGYLKVSFFGPFYGAYVVFELDREGYRWAAVSGPDRSYLWLLARTPTVDAAVRERMVARARALGFDTDRLIWVSHAAP